MFFVRYLLFVLSASLCSNALALERRYLAEMHDAQWTLTGDSQILCRLEHPIPNFGRAVFTREAGRHMQLELFTSHKFKKGIDVKLYAETVHWKRREPRSLLAGLKTSGRESLFSIPTKVAERAFHELGEGNRPGFMFDVHHPVTASLSTVRFGQVEQTFAECVARLHDHNFDDVRLSQIHFNTDDEFASFTEEEKAFVRMLDYLRVDDAISEIVVSGHADKIGPSCYNDGLSERRALYVYDLLITRGIDSGKLRMDYYGESIPVKRGNSNTSLAANRRVTVELRR